MTAVMTLDKETPLGSKSRNLRISLLLTQRELAGIAGVSQTEVNLFEHNLPVCLDARRKLLKELWTRRIGKRQ